MSTCALTARRVSPHSHLPPTRGGGPRLAISPYAPCERRGPSSHSAWHSPRGAWNVEAARSHTTDLGLSNDNYDRRDRVAAVGYGFLLGAWPRKAQQSPSEPSHGTPVAQPCPRRRRTRASPNHAGGGRPFPGVGETPLAAFRILRPRESGHYRATAAQTEEGKYAREPGHYRLRPRKGTRETSRSDPGVASRHASGTAPKYPTTHATCAVGNEGNESVCQTRVCQPGGEHQGPRRLLDPHASGPAR